MFYDWQLYVIIGLTALAGLIAGLLIGTRPKKKEEAVMRVHETWVNPTYNVRRHEKVEICGAVFERM